MNPIHHLNTIFSKRPELEVTVDPPADPSGVWTLDLRSPKRHIIVEWSKDSGIGVSDAKWAAESYGERPDEHFDDLRMAAQRIEQLIDTDHRASPPLPILLSRLREERGLTQKELAARLGITQASISGIERRGDIQFSTLKRLVEALGGELDVCAKFQDASYQIHWGSSGLLRKQYVLRVVRTEPQDAVYHIGGAFPCLRECGQLESALAGAVAIRNRGATYAFVD